MSVGDRTRIPCRCDVVSDNMLEREDNGLQPPEDLFIRFVFFITDKVRVKEGDR